MGTHMRVLSEGYPMNTNITGFRRVSKIFAACISIVKVKYYVLRTFTPPPPNNVFSATSAHAPIAL